MNHYSKQLRFVGCDRCGREFGDAPDRDRSTIVVRLGVLRLVLCPGCELGDRER